MLVAETGDARNQRREVCLGVFRVKVLTRKETTPVFEFRRRSNRGRRTSPTFQVAREDYFPNFFPYLLSNQLGCGVDFSTQINKRGGDGVVLRCVYFFVRAEYGGHGGGVLLRRQQVANFLSDSGERFQPSKLLTELATHQGLTPQLIRSSGVFFCVVLTCKEPPLALRQVRPQRGHVFFVRLEKPHDLGVVVDGLG